MNLTIAGSNELHRDARSETSPTQSITSKVSSAELSLRTARKILKTFPRVASEIGLHFKKKNFSLGSD